ncbi:cobalamin-dependent protein [Streptomyces sp. NBC_01754]|uniref:cobalamin B12-binding domain-containing protein n=1 Tax=Streptomyces sp. NBC_01754 TaxID=2975930 RepID=UPI002DD7EA2C|nr:cobalamin-dependent protein [Streptomyces sp. NBC_01754]WSC94326.1 cobalamin-dependent protein [Streptomyces sp. NBC_01754]
MASPRTSPALPAERWPERAAHRGRGPVVVSGVASDAHTWNLVFLQLLIEELGYEVVNLGPCVPDETLVEECRALRPELVVISSVNGHGHQDGLRLIGALRGCEALVATPVVIGGKLAISDENPGQVARELAAAGYDAVFPDGTSGVADFRAFLGMMSRPALAAGSRSDA